MNPATGAILGLLLAAGTAGAQAQENDLLRRAAAIKPRPEELRWRKIPWVTDLLEGQRVARAEGRPIFLWGGAGAPLQRGSGVPEGLRAGPLSDDEVIRRISTMFVPVAIDLWEVRADKGPAGDLLRSVRKQMDQYQGFWIVSPEGKALAMPTWKEHLAAASAVRNALDEVLQSFGPVKPREAKWVDPLPHRGTGVQPEGSVTLAIYGRLMHRGQPDGPIMMDNVTLGAAEWAHFAPPKRGTQEWTVPEEVARKLVGALAPTPRGMDFRPDGAKKAELKAKVESIEGGKARLLLSGTWEAHGVREGVPYSGAATSEGIALFDVEKQSLLSLLMVFTGTFGEGRGARETGGVVEWRVAPVQDRVLRNGRPEDVGMSRERLEEAARILEEETRSGRILSASIWVARRGVVVLERGSGVYIVASVTKPVAVTSLLVLADRGRVSLTDPVQKVLPEFQGAQKEKVRVGDLLSHVSGLPGHLPEDLDLRRAQAPLPEFTKRTLSTPLLFAPRTSFQYSNIAILLAGEIAERISGKPLREFLKQEIFDPLGMKGSSLGLGGRKIEETAWCQGISTSFKTAEDEKRFGANTLYWRDIGHPWGGMHSTARDLGVFLQLFLNGGIYDGKRILAAATIEAMTSDRNAGAAAPWGWGWSLKRSPIANTFGDRASDRTFGHVGATGTVIWADPDRDLACVILTTRAWDEDRGALLGKISTLVQSAIEK